ncbi:hypothetical protein [Neobacillus niacini]
MLRTEKNATCVLFITYEQTDSLKKVHDGQVTFKYSITDKVLFNTIIS